jgi:A/G-specific adenine glycosylase
MTREKGDAKNGDQPLGSARTMQPAFSRQLLAWYDLHARDLPWRKNHDPYRIWLSEIMLQQTRVAAVLEHYRSFLSRFPTVQKLAAAREASVLAAWSGLGYYRRARMLHAAAKAVVKEHGGQFPKNSSVLRGLPGIGRYTAAAIASIAHAEATAVVDGNVERVLARLFGQELTTEATWQVAQGLLETARPGDFNQAMMELGATVCLPREPKCLLCPVSEFCATRGELLRAKPSARQKKLEIHFGLALRDRQVFLIQRKPDESLMPGMWELPRFSGQPTAVPLFALRHSITVTDYAVRVMELPSPDEQEGMWIAASRLPSLPLTGLARKILRRAEML